ncbi:Phage DNA packaging protein Nu1 [Fulvimarina manganoxydans]|uniref:Phage DNA packaging protein Nu1 n=1 Tax=Fulvimarina manganoxydans TaxID=937218 RepID=A0A1W1Z3G8_9HYPH|nr:terminase small subunit [Fulvimarina manganoxydans]SMC42862.1 Phage DNA packaging protein Nu1 [Fulvimarina manganoxydans]
MPSTVSQIALAELLDVTPKTVRAWERQGCPVEVKSRKRGQPSEYLVADVVRWREQQAALAASGDLSAMDMDEAKRRKLAAEAAMAEIVLDKERGEIAEIATIMGVVGKGLESCRARLLGISSKIAPILAMETDATTAKEIVDDAIHEALNEISGPAFAFADEAEGDGEEGADGSFDEPDDAASNAHPKRMG